MLDEKRIPVSQLVAPEGDKVLSEIYNDEQVFQTEMEAIFESTWIWVAHESEIIKQPEWVGIQLSFPVIEKWISMS